MGETTRTTQHSTHTTPAHIAPLWCLLCLFVVQHRNGRERLATACGVVSMGGGPWPPNASIQPSSVATTGGVYKWQGRNLCQLMTDAYEAFHVHGGQLQSPIPSTATTEKRQHTAHTSHRERGAKYKTKRGAREWTDLQGFPATSSQGPQKTRRAPSHIKKIALAPSPCQCSARAAQDIWEHHRPAVGSSMRALVAAYTAPQRSESRNKKKALGWANTKMGGGASSSPGRRSVLRRGYPFGNKKSKTTQNSTTQRGGDGPTPMAQRITDPTKCEPEARWEGDVSLVIGINQTNHSTNQERPCTTVHRIKKELSVCPSQLRPDLVTFPALSQIKPHTPRLVVPFRQFL